MYTPDEPCIFPFNYLGRTYDKCATVWNTAGAMLTVEVNLQKQLKIFPGGLYQPKIRLTFLAGGEFYYFMITTTLWRSP